MKVNDLKYKPLEEGFIDNLIAKVQSMAGGDGLTGLVRSLQGNGAQLKRIADTIKNGLEAQLRSKAGASFSNIQQNKVEVPLVAIIKLGLTSAEKVSATETDGEGSANVIGAAQIADFIKNNKASVITVAGLAGGNQIIDSIVQVASGAKPAPIANLKYNNAIDDVCLAIAAAMILATGEDIHNTPAEMDPAVKQRFEEFGKQILDILLDPTNGLKQNQDFVDNIENLIFVKYLRDTIFTKYIKMSAAQLTALITNPPTVLSPGEYKQFLMQHDPSIDQTVLTEIIGKLTEAVQGHLKAFLELASTEAALGRKPEQSFELAKVWGRSVHQRFQQSNFTAPAPTAPAPTESIQSTSVKLNEVRIRATQLMKLTEAKARIDHPEDLIFEEGTAGAKRALQAIVHAAGDPTTSTVKWDGTPAIIFGRDENGFVFTDKSGFGAKKYDGMARSSTMFRDMIYNRKPDEPGRLEYSTQLARLFPMLEKMLPMRFRGFVQGDIMWLTTPQEHDGVIDIQPLKVKYTIDGSSDLGKKIKKSQAGIVVHSYFSDKTEDEPRAMTPTEIASLKPSPGLVVLSPVMEIRAEPFELPTDEISRIERFIADKGPVIDRLLDNMAIGALKISNLPDIFKSFLNYRAYQGEDGFSQKQFLAWLNNPADSKLTANKLNNVLDHLKKNENGFNAVFKLANLMVSLKYTLKDQLDSHAGQNSTVLATVRGRVGHEGFVADTPHGKIKLVNRPVFMKKV